MPFFDRDGWWGRAALDVSTPRAPWRLLVGPAVTWGPEAYALPTGAAEDYGLSDDVMGPYSQLRRTEVRLSAAVAVAYSGASAGPTIELDGIGFRGYRGTTWILGIVPHVALSAADERRACVGCATGVVDRFDVAFGAALVAGVAWFDPSKHASPFAPERLRIE
jgi:hypothetical protein